MGLFSGKPESKQRPSPGTPARPSAPTPTLSAPQAPTVIGKDAIVKGELISTSDMLVEGRVEGKIKGDKTVIIGETGRVEAQVQAQVVSVRGEVQGDCEASNKVEITATGKVFGNIAAEAIVVAEGATFRGASKMVKRSQPKPLERPPSERTTAPSSPRTSTPPPSAGN